MESTGAGSGYLSPMELLPTEILQKIMGYLPIPDRVRVERVCKKWQNASTEVIWTDVQTLIIEPWTYKHRGKRSSSDYSNVITVDNNRLSIDAESPDIIENLVSRVGHNVKKFIFDTDEAISMDFIHTEIVLSIIAVYCRNIESIELCNIEDMEITLLPILFKMNKNLHSIACIGMVDVVDIVPLNDWKSLYLGRSPTSDMTDSEKDHWEKKVVTLIDHSPSLENFYVYDSGPLIITAISKCENLKNFLFPMNDGIATNNLAMDTTLLNRLTSLRIEGVKNKDNLIINLLRHCINVESLGLYYTKREIPIRVLHAVLALPKLESLDLESEFTEEIMNYLGKFKHLILSSCTGHIKENLIIGLIEKSEDLEKLDVYLKQESIEKLVQNTRNRRKILKLRVRGDSMYEKALETCKDSRIHVFQEFNDLMNYTRNWIPWGIELWETDSE